MVPGMFATVMPKRFRFNCRFFVQQLYSTGGGGPAVLIHRGRPCSFAHGPNLRVFSEIPKCSLGTQSLQRCAPPPRRFPTYLALSPVIFVQPTLR
jgi:hypothetical protein